MKNKILELEKSLFKYEYMTDIAYLNEIIDDQYIEVGKSGKQFNKEDVIKEVIYFLARNISDNKQAQLEEVSEVKWFSMEDAIEQITFDNSREILIQLKKDLEKKGSI